MPQADTRLSKEERLRDQLFGEVRNQVFDTRSAGFVPVAIEYRKLLKFLTPPQVRVFLYLILRANKFGVCFPTIEEIAYDIGVAAKKHVRPMLGELEAKGFIRTAMGSGRQYFLVLDPSIAISKLRSAGEISDVELQEINWLRMDLNREPIPM